MDQSQTSQSYTAELPAPGAVPTLSRADGREGLGPCVPMIDDARSLAADIGEGVADSGSAGEATGEAERAANVPGVYVPGGDEGDGKGENGETGGAAGRYGPNGDEEGVPKGDDEELTGEAGEYDPDARGRAPKVDEGDGNTGEVRGAPLGEDAGGLAGYEEALLTVECDGGPAGDTTWPGGVTLVDDCCCSCMS